MFDEGIIALMNFLEKHENDIQGFLRKGGVHMADEAFGVYIISSQLAI